MSKNKNERINPMEIVTKNSEKAAQTINILSKDGGTSVFTQKIDGATNLKLLLKSLEIVREKTNDKFCLLLISCCERNVYMCVYVLQKSELNGRAWLLNLVENFDGFQVKRIDSEVDTVQFTCDKETTPFKMMDNIISRSYEYLRKIGVLNEEESGDENYSNMFEW